MKTYFFRDCATWIFPSAHGHALTAIALDRGIRRKWFEWIPILGDRWLRRRLTAEIRQPRDVDYGQMPAEIPDAGFTWKINVRSKRIK